MIGLRDVVTKVMCSCGTLTHTVLYPTTIHVFVTRGAKYAMFPTQQNEELEMLVSKGK